MRDTIETWAQLVSIAAVAVMFIALTVQNVAGNKAASVAFSSPAAVFFTLIFAVALAAHMGWLK